ncbi:MAG: hypothetical protein FWE27_08020 [Defluviitaleaceae bacterium]|nr:hypothetical protein [Defluviitaleaceae bacterium]
MINTDVFEFEKDEIRVLLDVSYAIKFTLKAVFQLEKRYGSMPAALKALLGENPDEAKEAAVSFLCVLTGLNPEKINENMDALRFRMAFEGLTKALKRDFPDKKDCDPEDEEENWQPNDWDYLYAVGRMRLLMNEDEFLETTPRRFFKLHYLWRLLNGHEQPEEEVYTGALTH